MNIPSWATIAYRWKTYVCYSDGTQFVGYQKEEQIWKGKWGVPGTQTEAGWVEHMKKNFPTFRVESIILIEENE